MRDPITVPGRAITRAPSANYGNYEGAARNSAFNDIAQAATAIGRVVSERNKVQSSEQAEVDFAKASEEADGTSAVLLPSRKFELLGMEFESAGDEMYNLTVQTLALNRARQDARSQIMELRQAHANNPQALQDALDSWSTGYVNGADEIVGARIENTIGPMIQEAVSSEAAARMNADRLEAQDTSVQEINRLQIERVEEMERGGIASITSPAYARRVEEMTDQIDILVADPTAGYTEEWGRQIVASAVENDIVAGMGAELRMSAEAAYGDGDWDGAISAVDQKLEELETYARDEYGVEFNVNQRNAARARAMDWIETQEGRRGKREREAEKARTEAQASQYHALLRDDADGNLTYSRLSQMWAEDKISEGQYTSLYVSKRNQDEAEARRQTASASIESGLFDPTDSDHRKVINGGFQSLVNGGASVEDATFGMVREYGVVPDDASRMIRASYFNGEPGQKQQALDMIAQIDEMRPGAADAEFTSEQLRDARLYRDTVAATGDVEVAMQRVLQSQEVRLQPGYQDVLKNARDMAVDQVTDKTIREAFDPGSRTFLSDPRLPADPFTRSALVSSYQEEWAQAYAETRDKSAANTAASAALRRTYGVSSITGSKQIMRHPPEQYYGVAGADPDYMNRQLQADVAQYAPRRTLPGLAGTVIGSVPDVTETRLVADRETDRSAAEGRPTYRVTIKRQDGTVEAIVDDDGVPMRWAPDPREPVMQRQHEVEEMAKERPDALERRRRIEQGFTNLGQFPVAPGSF